MGMKATSLPTFAVTIYVAGPIEQAKQVCREYCWSVGLCVTVTPTTFIYTGGEETGYAVGLVNYPRFPSLPGEIREKARSLAERLIEATHQKSALLVMPELTEWIAREPIR